MDQLVRRDWKVSMIHGDMSAVLRENALSAFRSGASRVLLSTDHLLRGTDLPQNALTLHYDVPFSVESYGRHVERHGRFGSPGALAFVLPEDQPMLKEIEQKFEVQIQELPLEVVEEWQKQG
jgi:translation initiation factor 4A